MQGQTERATPVNEEPENSKPNRVGFAEQIQEAEKQAGLSQSGNLMPINMDQLKFSTATGAEDAPSPHKQKNKK